MSKIVTDKTLESDVINSTGLVLVDFWADWCGPCKQLGSVLEEVEGELAGKIEIAKINADENSEAAAKFGVRGLPTMIVFKDGKKLGSKTGSMTRKSLLDWINTFN